MKKFKFWIASLVLLSLFFGACRQASNFYDEDISPYIDNDFMDDGIFRAFVYGEHCTIIGYLSSFSLPSDLVIPDTIGGKKVTRIDMEAFYGCTSITTLDLSGCTKLTEIGRGAFLDCTGITTLDLPDSLTEIDRYAFSGCTGIKEVIYNADFRWKVQEDWRSSWHTVELNTENFLKYRDDYRWIREDIEE